MKWLLLIAEIAVMMFFFLILPFIGSSSKRNRNVFIEDDGAKGMWDGD